MQQRFLADRLVDVSKSQKSQVGGRLAQVGMSEVELPLRFVSQGESWRLMSRCEVMVSLDDDQAKGIHMSRLYQLTQEYFDCRDFQGADQLKELLELLRDSQEGLSQTASICLQFEWPLRRQALKSEGSGWRSYPVAVEASLGPEGFLVRLNLEIVYASTCPCSAALARQLIQEKFVVDFKGQDSLSFEEVSDWLGQEKSIAGVPHAQRSFARLQLEWKDSVALWPVEELVNEAELVLGTPVQTYVKREDEQEFARLNASDLKFCEDAARKLQNWLKGRSDLRAFSGEVIHVESLHAHSAVARFQSGY